MYKGARKNKILSNTVPLISAKRRLDKLPLKF